MGVKANLSLWGMYKYDRQGFEANLNIPESLDKSTLVKNLLMECADMRLLYTDKDFFYDAVGYWSEKQVPIWQAVIDILAIEYDPQYNYNKYEAVSDDTQHTGTDTKDMTGTDTVNRTGTDTKAHTGTTGTVMNSSTIRDLDKTDNKDTEISEVENISKNDSGSTLNSVNGFNVTTGPTTMVEHDKSETSNTTGQAGSKHSEEDADRTINEDESISDSSASTTTNNLQDQQTRNLQDQETRNMRDVATKNLRDYLVHNGHYWGNIGTMTTQQMLREELELRKINIYDIIVNDFKKQFCLGIYY